jgi:acyl-coenzyme A thioesterase PaaI-like protein
MNIDEPLDIEKMEKYSAELQLEFANIIINRERSKENHGAAVAALCDVAVLIACRLVGIETAYEEIIPMAIAHGFQMAKNNKKIMEL